jgi:hypothetical protein
LAVSVIETSPADLEERIKSKNVAATLIEKVENERIFLTPILLNPGDSITIQLLSRNTSGVFTVSGHLQGIKSITQLQENRVWTKILTYFGAMTMAFAMLGVEPSDIVNCAFEHFLPWILIFLTGLTVLSAGIYWPKNNEIASLQPMN